MAGSAKINPVFNFILIFFIGILIPVLSVNAQSDDYISDSSAIDVKVPEKKIIDGYRSDSDYQYKKAIVKEKNLWQKFADWVSRLIYRILFVESRTDTGKIVIYIIIALLVIFLILFFTRHQTGLLVALNKKIKKNKVIVLDEDIMNTNLDILYENALLKREYRLAVRYLYLKTLKILNNGNIINYQVNKTNHQYVYEIADQDLRRKFSDITLIFNYIWYGDIKPDESIFSKVHKKFKAFDAIAGDNS